jgi:hypothetical protein
MSTRAPKIPTTSFERMQYLDQCIKEIVKEFQKPDTGFLARPLEDCTGMIEEFMDMDNFCSPAMTPVHRVGPGSSEPVYTIENPAVNSRMQYNEIFPHQKVRLTCIICKCRIPSTANKFLQVYCSAMPYMPVCEPCWKEIVDDGFEA